MLDPALLLTVPAALPVLAYRRAGTKAQGQHG